MPLVFTDPQIRNISGEILALPADIIKFTNDKAYAVAAKAEALANDQANEVFSNNFRDIISAYHDELKNKNGSSRTLYDVNNIVLAAKKDPANVHYPIPSSSWVNIKPKIHLSNNGDPVGAFTPYEQQKLAPITSQIALLKTGFTDGATDTTTGNAYVFGVDLGVNGVFLAGQRIVVDRLNVSLLATIVTVKPPTGAWTADLELSILAPPAGALPSGSRVRNFHNGFSNAEREGTATPYAPEVLAYWESILDGYVQDWEDTIVPQQTALGLLNVSGTENTQKVAEQTSLSNAKTAIDNWQAAPATGAGVGRYGDTALTPIEANIAARTAAIPVRVTQITTNLGVITQAPNGDYSGSGHYLKLFEWIDIRAGMAGGSLFLFYQADLAISFIDQKIAKANSKKIEYEAQFLVKTFTADSDGTVFIKVANTTGLSISDAVKIAEDSGLPLITTTIVGISGLIVELAATVTGFTVDNRARLVKQL